MCKGESIALTESELAVVRPIQTEFLSRERSVNIPDHRVKKKNLAGGAKEVVAHCTKRHAKG